MFWSNVHIGETSEAEAVLKQRWNRWSSQEGEDWFFFPVDPITLQQQVLFVWWILYICHWSCCNDVNPSFVTPKSFQDHLVALLSKSTSLQRQGGAKGNPIYRLLKKNRRAPWRHYLNNTSLKTNGGERPTEVGPSFKTAHISAGEAKSLWYWGEPRYR